MMLKEPDYVELIVSHFSLKKSNVVALLGLLEEQNTVPFIARYRKEVTNNLDENQIREIIDFNTKEESLYKAKKTAINGIDEQEKLTEELEKRIISCKSLKDVEDIYAPFRLKRKTKAMKAKEKGFGVVAELILKQKNLDIPSSLIEKYPKEEIVEGAKDIVVEEIALDIKNKEAFRFYFTKYGYLESKYKGEKSIDKLPEKVKGQKYKFEIYSNFNAEVDRLKSYQILALNRGEDLKLLNVKLEKDDVPLEDMIERYVVFSVNREILVDCLKLSFKRLFKSVETEIRSSLTLKAQEVAISTFQENLRKLLLTKPQHGKKVLAIDPGFRTGCKVAVIDENNVPQGFSTIYLHRSNDGVRIVKEFVSKYCVEVIVIGNGTASNETYELLKGNVGNLPIYIVNESGASVYSAGEVANDEFPDLDVTQRGTISIGRRFVDPLAELVKISPQNIGVGMYQHDMNQKELEKKLNYVIEDVVNLVGINVNTSSVYLLSKISGLNKRSAKKVVDNLPYKSRKNLRKVLSKKGYEQACGFLRVPESAEELDNTNIHPEQYGLAKFILSKGVNSSNFDDFLVEMKKLYSDVGIVTVEYINLSFKNSGEEVRKHDAILKIDKVLDFDNVSEGDIVKGVVRNIMQFGVFVDVGLKNDGLIHISQLADKFVKDPADIVQIGQELKVKILSIDKENKKVGLSLKDI